MKALTVLQPWAWALIHGEKRIENRSWKTSYRGPLAIHAGKSHRLVKQFIRNDKTDVPSILPKMDKLDLHFGVVIGIVDLIAILPATQCRKHTVFTDQHRFIDPGDGYCWCLENPRPLPEPIPWIGSLSLFDVDDDLILD